LEEEEKRSQQIEREILRTVFDTKGGRERGREIERKSHISTLSGRGKKGAI